jgi:hypothetical protein
MMILIEYAQDLTVEMRKDREQRIAKRYQDEKFKEMDD